MQKEKLNLSPGLMKNTESRRNPLIL